MKLEIEFVPTKLRYSSFWRVFSKEEWDNIKNKITEENGRCQICGETGDNLTLDAMWNYNDNKHVQRLEGFILICEMCHYIKHLGIAETLADRGLLDYNRLIDHFCKVNNCSREEFEERRAKAYEIWERRSMYKWKRDLGNYRLWKKKVKVTKT